MSISVLVKKLFLVTWDSGNDDREQTLKIPHEDFYNEPEIYQKNIIIMKCLHCGFESCFGTVEKEKVN